MSYKILTLIIFLNLISNVSFAQNQKTPKLNLKDFYGTWTYNAKGKNKNITLTKLSEIKKIVYSGWTIEFLPEKKLIFQFLGGFKDCEMDTRHIPKNGSWILNKKKKILKTTEFESSENNYQILEFSPEKVTIKKIN